MGENATLKFEGELREFARSTDGRWGKKNL